MRRAMRPNPRRRSLHRVLNRERRRDKGDIMGYDSPTLRQRGEELSAREWL